MKGFKHKSGMGGLVISKEDRSKVINSREKNQQTCEKTRHDHYLRGRREGKKKEILILYVLSGDE